MSTHNLNITRMTLLNTSNALVWTLLIACVSTLLAIHVSQFPRHVHFQQKERIVAVAFLAVGDWGRGGNFNQSEVAKQMGEIGRMVGIDFVISTGDNFYDTGIQDVNDPQFQDSFTQIYTAPSLQVPWYSVLGNHDYMGNSDAQVSKVLRAIDNRWRCKRNFIIAAGAADIFFMDTNPFVEDYFTNTKKKDKYNWTGILPREKYLTSLLTDLDHVLSKSEATWKIVVGHHTIRSIGHHGDTPDMVEHILPILEAHNVDMYINGHDHCMEHISNKEGTIEFLTSGGGSKAWKNDMHEETLNGTKHFYHDGQGFISVLLDLEKADVVFYDVYRKPMHKIQLTKKNDHTRYHERTVL